MHRLSSLVVALLLCGCEAGVEPIRLDPDSDMFGAWEYQFDEFGNGVTTDQFLLIFHQDSTVDYKRCKNHVGGYSYTKMPNASILEVNPHRIRIGVDLFLITLDKELDFEKFPYEENGDTFMKVDGARLRRLRPGQSSDHESWKCSSDDEDDKT